MAAHKGRHEVLPILHRALTVLKIPQSYLATNWPIRYSALSTDGRLIAVAGRRGLVHYSSTSGRWKLFSDELQEQAFAVRGGFLWFHHVLIAAVEVSKTFQVSSSASFPSELCLEPVTLDQTVFAGSRTQQPECAAQRGAVHPGGDPLARR